jgi:flagellar biogenesis protein FliO
MILGITPSSISLLLQLPDQNGQLKENEEPNFKNTLNKAFQNTDNK